MFGEMNINRLSEESPTEAELISDISDTRHEEIIRYGRVETFEEIDHYLEGDFRRAFMLVNHVPAILIALLIKGNSNEQCRFYLILVLHSESQAAIPNH